jgi:dTDP-4-amino-4,6-dideoxygalactose transaminase
MCDPVWEYRSLKGDIDGAVARVFERGLLDWGPEVPDFEDAFAGWAGTAHAVGFNSGMAALKIGLKALGVGPGDEVITVPNSDISTTSAIHHVGAQSVWIDVEPDTLTMDPTLVEEAITERTKALLPVHLYGHPADMTALCDIARKYDLFVIEDACLAVGASIDGRPVGTWGDVACFSHAPSKHLGACGSAGTAVTNDESVAERMRLLVGYGEARHRKYDRGKAGGPQHYVAEGSNERMDELQASILRVKLGRLNEWLAVRRANAEAYSDGLRDTGIRLPMERPGCRHTYRNYVVRVSHRKRTQKVLAGAGIASAQVYVPPLHLQPVYHRLGYERGAYPVTEEACETLLSIPVGPHLSPDQREYVIRTLAELEA